MEAFPTTPRVPAWVRLCAMAIGLAGVLLATTTTVTSARWIGRVFPGFLLMDNGVIVSIGLPHWSGASVPDLFQSELVRVNGRPLRSVQEAYATVAALPPDTAVRYEVRKYGRTREVTLRTQRFTLGDWSLVFGAYLLNSFVFLTSGLLVWVLQPRAPLGRAFLVFGATWALFFLTGMDLYGPGTLTRLHFVSEPLTVAAAFHLVLMLPHPHRWARLRFAGYLLALGVMAAYQTVLYRPARFSALLMVDMLALGVVGVLFGARLLPAYFRERSPLARQRIRLMALGTAVGFGLPGVILVASALSGGDVAMNTAVLTPLLFVASLAYAVVKHDLFEIDAMVKRGAYYLLLTGAVGTAYVAAVMVLNLVLEAGAVADSPAFPVFFTLAVLLVFNPLRARLQAIVDGVFFRTPYDGARVLATAGDTLATALTREDIATLVCDTVRSAIPNASTRLFVGSDGTGLREIATDTQLPAVLGRRLGSRRIVSAFDAPETYPDGQVRDAVQAALAGLEAQVALPLSRGDDLVGVLTVGVKRSGLFYTAGDVEFLRALAHQAATALENTRTYEALIALNTRLEERVRERTAQIEAANRELAEAYRELKLAETQVVQSEKMASLGRLVAGVAHEINNPVSFIATNVAPLRRRLARLAHASPAEAEALAREAEEIVDVMARGAERTAAIVRDLRTFSRLGEATRKPLDLQEGLEVSLRLLESRWRGRIAVHRDYVPLPLVEGDAGQLNQVFMNLLANACDAIAERGNLWLATRTADGEATVAIRDDGIGMPPETRARIFEPFFTTKDVGSGTGLGLAISHGVVAAHGGRIEVESAPGAGATFRVVLPTSTGDDT